MSLQANHSTATSPSPRPVPEGSHPTQANFHMESDTQELYTNPRSDHRDTQCCSVPSKGCGGERTGSKLEGSVWCPDRTGHQGCAYWDVGVEEVNSRLVPSHRRTHPTGDWVVDVDSLHLPYPVLFPILVSLSHFTSISQGNGYFSPSTPPMHTSQAIERRELLELYWGRSSKK